MPDETNTNEFSDDNVKALFEMRPGLSEVTDRLGINTLEISDVVSRGADISAANSQFGRCAELNTRPSPNTPVEFNLGHEDPNRPDVDKVFHPTALAIVVAIENNILFSDERVILPIIYRGKDGQAKVVTAKVSTAEFETLNAQAAAWRREHPKEEAPTASEAEEVLPITGDGLRNLLAPGKPSRPEMLRRLHSTEQVEPNGGGFEINDGQRFIIGSKPHETGVGGQVDGCVWIEKSDIPEAALALTLDNQGNVVAEALLGAKVYVVRGGINGTIELLNGKATIPEKDSNNTHFAIERKNSKLVMLQWGGENRGTESGSTSRSIRYRTEETDMEAVRGWAIK